MINMKSSPTITLITSALGFSLCAAVHHQSFDNRRVLRSYESVADHIRRLDDTNYGLDAPRFTITAEIQGIPQGSDGDAEPLFDPESDPNTISIDVVKVTNPAITSETFIFSPDGTRAPFGSASDYLDTILVSDTQTSKGRSELAILAVNERTREMQGIVLVDGRRGMMIQQGGGGGVVTAVMEEEMEMPAWECGVGKEEITGHLFHRDLGDEHNHDTHEHDHQHPHHEDFNPTISIMENLSNSLRGTKVNPLNKRHLQNSNLSYNYQVDLFIEIDAAFITKTGGGTPDAAGITQNAYNYINTLVTSANIIYESEIDTHLHVHTIKRSTLYDAATGTPNALTIMRTTYGRTTWHTEGVDLHHALLGMNLGGGIAYIGVICDSGWGFGLTSSLSGTFVSLNSRVVWDMKAFMHEIGHNFASGHTHDSYTPAVDTCGTSCPSTAVGYQWSTLMSYCHGCPGDYGNIMYTFGGIYDGSGLKSDIANWMDKPNLVANYDSTHKSVDPRRESYTMYSHVSSRGSCVSVAGSPTTSKPTSFPTRKPTKLPTNLPTVKLTTKPSNAPSKKTTLKPTNSPSRKPTLSPTKKPTLVLTMKPSSSPTRKPTSSPSTSAPSSKKPTSPPSKSPVTPKPSSKPTTQPPTNPPTFSNVQQALFDSNFGVARCAFFGNACSSGILIDGRDQLSGRDEPNNSNTLDGCMDGHDGSYHSDESIDKIIVRSGEVDGSGSGLEIVEGGRATIIASVYAWSTGASDTADFFFAANAANPIWQYIGSITPPGGQVQELKMAYTLPYGTNQAVRVQFRYGGINEPCANGGYNDRDDLVFAVKPTVVLPPTPSPSTKSPTTSTVVAGPKVALFDVSLRVPLCSSYGSECSSAGLLNGRGTLNNGNEPNKPNALSLCVDGNSGTYHSDESIDKIVVRSGEVDGSGSGIDMAEGGRATIIATVYAWGTGSGDFADFYYASDASNPVWYLIGTLAPTNGGLQELKRAYTLPRGTNQAVRVNFRYAGVQGTNGACSIGNYDDTDDLAFGVKYNPSLLTDDVVSNVVEPPKDAAVDSQKRADIFLNENTNRTPTTSKASKTRKY